MITFLKKLQFIILLLYVSHQSLTPRPEEIFELASDKFLHVAAWFGLLVSLYVALNREKLPATYVFVLFLYSIAIEILQIFVPNRHFSFFDIFANGVGVVIGFLLIYLYKKIINKKPA